MKVLRMGIPPSIVVALAMLVAPAASAGTIPIGIGAFGAGSTLTTFTGLADGTEVNGLTVDGIQFAYSVGNGQVIIDGGPGVTNNIAPPNITSIRDNTGVLSLTFPSPLDAFGYGFAILAVAAIPDATTISLFNGAIPVGSLSFAGVPDPAFTGGFAGIQSTQPFNIAQITFNSTSASAFALDNIRTIAAVPEPGCLVLVGAGIMAVVRRRRCV